MYKAPIILTALLVCCPAFAGGTGGDMYAACISEPGSKGDLICDSYINGFANGIFADQIEAERGTPICIPDHTTTGQIREVLKKFFEDNPLAKTAASGVAVSIAMMQAFPCKKAK